MAIPKLFTALETLSKEEWSSLRKFILSNTRRESENFACFSAISDQKKRLNIEGLDEEIKAKGFSSMSTKNFSNIISKLFSWYEDWFAIETFQNERYAKELALVKGYNSRGLFKLANRLAEKLEQKIKNNEKLDIDQNATLAKLYHAQYYSSNPIKKQKDSSLLKDCVDHYIYATSEYATSYLLELENYNNVREKKYADTQQVLLDLIKSKSNNSSDVERETLNNILWLAYKMLCNSDLESLLKMKSILQSKVIDESSDLYLILTIYFRRSVCRLDILGHPIDPIDIFDSFQLSFKAIEKNRHQKLLPIVLFNGVSTLAVITDYESIEVFIKKWVPMVHTSHRESVFKYCQALNAFRHDRYEIIPKLLAGLEFDHHFYKIDSTLLLIIAQYKLDEGGQMLTLIQNLKKKLKRNSPPINLLQRKRINNLLDFIAILYKAKYDSSISVELADFQPIYYKSWALKQLSE